MTVRLGGCQCGSVRFRVEGPPLGLYVCHCRECQKQSASAFGLSLVVARSGFSFISGQPRAWSRTTDSGGRLNCYFCTDCGSRLFHESAPSSDTVTIKAGCLDEPVDLSSAVHIWTKRKVPGLTLPQGAKEFAEEPPLG